MWLFKSELLENAEPHTLQEYSFSLMCDRMCPFKCEFKEKVDTHIPQEYGLSSVCV